MNKINLLVIGIGLIIIGFLLLFNPAEFGQESEVLQELPKEEKAILIIDNGEEVKTFETEFSQGMTCFDLLKNKAEGEGLNLKTKEYDMGIIIEAIGDKENGEDNKYWLFYVNGEMAMVSADKLEMNRGDKIEFKFEKSIF